MPRRRHLSREQSRSPWTIILHLEGEKGKEGSPRATLSLQGLHFPPCVDVAWVDLLARVHFERENELRATRATKDEETRVKYGRRTEIAAKIFQMLFWVWAVWLWLQIHNIGDSGGILLDDY